MSVGDKEPVFNLETGYWRGSCGREGYGIDAYFEYEDGDDVYVVQWIVYHIDWRGGEADRGTYVWKAGIRLETAGADVGENRMAQIGDSKQYEA